MLELEPMFVAQDWTAAQNCAMYFRRYIIYDAFPGDPLPHVANAKTLDGAEFHRSKRDGTFDLLTYRIDKGAEGETQYFIRTGFPFGPNLVRFKGDDALPVCWDNA